MRLLENVIPVRLGRMAGAALLTVVMAGAANAQEVVRVSAVTAEGHWSWSQGIKVFASKVEAATKGKVKFQYFAAGQLGKNTSELVSKGLAQGGLVFPSFEPDKMPLTSVAELPGMHKTACESVDLMWKLVGPGGPLNEAEYGKRGLRPIYAYNLPVYELQTSKKKITRLEDVAGQKIRANGSAQAKTVSALGGVPVAVPGPELYDSLTRGTVDGGLWLSLSSRDIGLEKVLKYRVEGPGLGSGGVSIFVMNEDAWKRLDADTQKALMNAGAETARSLCAWVDKTDSAEVASLTKDFGFETVKLSPTERARWDAALASVSKNWAAEMDSSGRPGTKTLETFKSMVGK